MFDLVTGKARHLPSRSTLPIVISTTAQAAAAVVAVTIPALFIADQVPRVPTMLAFVAPTPSAPPPPAPPPPARQRSAPAKPITQTEPGPSTREVVASVDVPRSLEAEPAAPSSFDKPVTDGVEGGVPGGIAGGLVGGLPEPPPPPPAPEAHLPIRIGGTLQPPALVRRVEPIYPPIAVSARMQGLVILEALVDHDGTVVEVKVLRSAGSVLDREALIAVRQWQYSPLVLNGQRKRFVLTVMLLFSVESVNENPGYAVRAK
jgi:periplasmic protein TonB